MSPDNYCVKYNECPIAQKYKRDIPVKSRAEEEKHYKEFCLKGGHEKCIEDIKAGKQIIRINGSEVII